MVSIFLRSALYNVAFYLNLAVWVVIGLPTYVMPRWGVLWVAATWGRTSIWLMEVICNVRVEYRGREKIPQGPLIVACKHQSAWETLALLQFFDQPFYILKRELTWLPFFGWYLLKAGMIGVNRESGGRSMIAMIRRASQQIRQGRQLLIFPEGTRRAPGAPPDYKNGVSLIYGEAGVPCVPAALNSGLFWPRRTFLRYPGTLVLEFLDPIPPGLKRKEFAERLSQAIEEASDRLVQAGREEQIRLLGFSAPVMSPEAQSRA